MAFMIYLFFFFFFFTTTNNVFDLFRSNTVPLFYCSSGMFEILQIIFIVSFYNHHWSVVIVHNSSTKLCIYKDCDSTHSPLFYLPVLSIPWCNHFSMNRGLNEKVGICSIHVTHLFTKLAVQKIFMLLNDYWWFIDKTVFLIWRVKRLKCSINVTHLLNVEINKTFWHDMFKS